MNENILAEEKFGTGGHRDTIDKRDLKFQDVASFTLPFDWSVGYDVETVIAERIGIPNWKMPTKDQKRSAKYIYAQTFVSPGGGSRGRDNCEIITKQGCARELLTPSYNGGLPPNEAFMTILSDISQDARNDALGARGLTYLNVNPEIDLFAQAIRDNHGLVMGISGQNNGTWNTTFPKPPASLSGAWGHWLYAGKAKMINGKKYIGVKNSWGNVGEDGWQWIGEDYFNVANAVWYGWTIAFPTQVLPPTTGFKFTRNLMIGMKGPDVKELQKYLNRDPDTRVANTGAGSPGQETENFGFLTQAAVIRLQMKHDINPALGFCFEKTRAFLNI